MLATAGGASLGIFTDVFFDVVPRNLTVLMRQYQELPQ